MESIINAAFGTVAAAASEAAYEPAYDPMAQTNQRTVANVACLYSAMNARTVYHGNALLNSIPRNPLRHLTGVPLGNRLLASVLYK